MASLHPEQECHHSPLFYLSGLTLATLAPALGATTRQSGQCPTFCTVPLKGQLTAVRQCEATFRYAEHSEAVAQGLLGSGRRGTWPPERCLLSWVSSTPSRWATVSSRAPEKRYTPSAVSRCAYRCFLLREKNVVTMESYSVSCLVIFD